MLLDRVRSVLSVPDDLGHVAPVQVPGFDRQDLVAAAFDAADVMAGQAGDGADDRHDGMLLCSPSRSLVNSETAGLRDGSAPQPRLRGTPWRGVDAARPRPAVDWKEQQRGFLLAFVSPRAKAGMGPGLKRPAVAGEAPLPGVQSPLRRDHSRSKVLSLSVSTRLA